jgi:hypothetical protein
METRPWSPQVQNARRGLQRGVVCQHMHQGRYVATQSSILRHSRAVLNARKS